jgi:hypothetical protein
MFTPQGTKMPGERVQFDLAIVTPSTSSPDGMLDFQELADEAFSKPLRKRGRPTDLGGSIGASDYAFIKSDGRIAIEHDFA